VYGYMRRLVSRYYAVNVLQTCGTITFRSIMTCFIVLAEVLVILSLYITIRMNISGGFLVALVVAMGGACYFVLKAVIKFSARLSEVSREFCKPGGLRNLNKKHKSLIASCKPLSFAIGSTCTVTRQTFPTITQDIILSNLVNMLVSY